MIRVEVKFQGAPWNLAPASGEGFTVNGAVRSALKELGIKDQVQVWVKTLSKTEDLYIVGPLGNAKRVVVREVVRSHNRKVLVSLAPDVLEALDEMAKASRKNRSEFVEDLVREKMTHWAGAGS